MAEGMISGLVEGEWVVGDQVWLQSRLGFYLGRFWGWEGCGMHLMCLFKLDYPVAPGDSPVNRPPPDPAAYPALI